MWNGLVELIRAAIFGASHVLGGSLGGGVLFVSFAVRLALLPLTLRIARRNRELQIKLAAAKPEIDALQERYTNDPARVMRETQAVYAKHGIRPLSAEGIAGFAIQAPLFSAFFAALRTGLGARARFLWVADLARPDGWLIAIVSLLTAGAVVATPAASGSSSNASRVFLLVAVGGTIALLWSASSAAALSVGAGTAVSVIQSWILRRDPSGAAATEDAKA
jgi:YidC/Oxa1 family membrane protein insertase